MNRHTAKVDSGILLGIVVALAGLAGLAAVLFWDTTGRGGSGLGPDFDYDVESLTRVDPGMIGYREAAVFDTGLETCRGLAVGPDDRIYVAGNDYIRVFGADGGSLGSMAAAQPRCLAVDADGTLYVGLPHRVAVFRDGRLADQWEDLGSDSLLTSVAVTSDSVFVADAGRRLVLRYDKAGKLVAEIGRKDAASDEPGFIVPSAYFDVAVAPDGRLRIVNPGKLRIEAWSFDGEQLFWWGEPGFHVRAFSGCCNPTHIAILPNGNVITAEKGTLRIKEYDTDGMLLSVVAGPDQLVPPGTAAAELATGFDVAVDGRGRVLVLDVLQNRVRIFVRKESP